MSGFVRRTGRDGLAALAALGLGAGVAFAQQGTAARADNPGLRVDAALADAILLYREGDYEGAIEQMEAAAEAMRLGHTARDGEQIEQAVGAYFLSVMEGEYERAFALLHSEPYMRRSADELAALHAMAREQRGVVIRGFVVLRVHFDDEPEKAWADVLVRGPGDQFVEASVRLEKLYVDDWILMGYPARPAGRLECLVPLESHPPSCAEGIKPPAAKKAP